MLRGATVSFLFEPLWLLAPTQHSVYLRTPPFVVLSSHCLHLRIGSRVSTWRQIESFFNILFSMHHPADIVKEVLDRAARGELVPQIAPVTFPLDKVHHAMRYVEAARPATVILHP